MWARLALAHSVVALLAWGETAHAEDEKAVCISTSELGQKLRTDGHLSAAREQLRACARDACPEVIRGDCAKLIGEIDAVMPTLVLAVRDPQGHDLVDVELRVDDQRVAWSLDGRPIAIDPGPHVLSVSAGGFQPMSKTLVFRENEKARLVDFSFGGAPPSPAPAHPPDAPGRHSAVPWVFLSVGAAAAAAGLVVLLTGTSKSSNALSGCSVADSQFTCTGVGLTETTARANDYQDGQTWEMAGGITLLAGIAVVGLSLLWHFLEPTKPPASRASMIIGPRSIGVSGTF